MKVTGDQGDWGSEAQKAGMEAREAEESGERPRKMTRHYQLHRLAPQTVDGRESQDRSSSKTPTASEDHGPTKYRARRGRQRMSRRRHHHHHHHHYRPPHLVRRAVAAKDANNSYTLPSLFGCFDIFRLFRRITRGASQTDPQSKALSVQKILVTHPHLRDKLEAELKRRGVDEPSRNQMRQVVASAMTVNFHGNLQREADGADIRPNERKAVDKLQVVPANCLSAKQSSPELQGQGQGLKGKRGAEDCPSWGPELQAAAMVDSSSQVEPARLAQLFPSENPPQLQQAVDDMLTTITQYLGNEASQRFQQVLHHASNTQEPGSRAQAKPVPSTTSPLCSTVDDVWIRRPAHPTNDGAGAGDHPPHFAHPQESQERGALPSISTLSKHQLIQLILSASQHLEVGDTVHKLLACYYDLDLSADSPDNCCTNCQLAKGTSDSRAYLQDCQCLTDLYLMSRGEAGDGEELDTTSSLVFTTSEDQLFPGHVQKPASTSVSSRRKFTKMSCPAIKTILSST